MFKYVVEVAVFPHKEDWKLWLDMSLPCQTAVPAAESELVFSDHDDYR